MKPESYIQSSILAYFKKLEKEDEPIFYENRQAGGFAYKKGIPDIYCVYYGKHIEIEVKREGGKRSTMQEKFEEKCKKNKILYICTTNVQEVKDLLLKVKSNYI